MKPSGFLAPTSFDDEICQFFSVCDLGPAINGQFITNTQGKQIPDLTTLESNHDIPLNDCLYFTIPDNNPLYGIINSGSLIPLFALHAYYANMGVLGDVTRLSASADMRKYLKQTLIKAIKKSAQDIIRSNINNVQIIDLVLNMIPILIQSIDDASLAQGQIMIGNHEMFNPNFFLYAHFSILISASKIKPLSKEELDLLKAPTKQVYQNLIPFNYTTHFGGAFIQLEDDKYIVIVLNYQKDIVSLAKDYKNRLQNIRQREKRALDLI